MIRQVGERGIGTTDRSLFDIHSVKVDLFLESATHCSSRER